VYIAYLAADSAGFNHSLTIKHTADLAQRIKRLETEFCGLYGELVSEVIKKRLPVDEFYRALTMLPIAFRIEYESSIQQMLSAAKESDGQSVVTSSVFLPFSPLFVFIDYDLLDHMITKFGSAELKRKMALYIEEVKLFMKETTVHDLIDHWPGCEVSDMNYEKLKAKFRDDPMTYTLERLNKFRRRFCSQVRLSEFIFCLISLESTESFFATWIIPAAIIPELSEAIKQLDEIFFREEHIISMFVDQKQLYPGQQLGASLQLEWRKADEKVGVKWNNAVVDHDNNVIYYMCGNMVHAHDMIHSRWTQLADCPHQACPMAIINNQLTTIGGLPLTDKLFTLRTDHDPMTWVEIYRSMLTKRRRASALCTNNELIVIGGMGESMSVLTAVEVMQLDTSPSQCTWSIAANLQEPTYDASIAICFGQIFILGGDNKDWKPCESVYMCSLRSLLESRSTSRQPNLTVWNRIANLPVMQSTCVTYSSRLLAVGGRESVSNTAVSTVYEYNHTTNSWEIISEMIMPRLKCFAAVLPNNKLVVVGEREIEIATSITNP
jgi:N-acetylneuraminic acid mutarotase